MNRMLASLAFAAVPLAALTGCATDVTTDDGAADEQPLAPAPAPASPAASDGELSTRAINLTGPCTVSTKCDVNYCCTTTDCRFTTTIECKPRLVNRQVYTTN